MLKLTILTECGDGAALGDGALELEELGPVTIIRGVWSLI